MKSIMISIRPEWTQKILNKEKLVEIRKTMPKCELPVKVYIYCTNNKKHTVAPFRFVEGWFYREYNDNTSYSNGCLANMGETINGKVVAEFTLNQVDTIEICDPCVLRNGEQQDWHWFKSNACLDSEEMMSYIGYGDDHDGWGSEYAKGYAWHIDDLKIYGKPKELSEFSTISHRMKGKESRFTSHLLQRPFQSWGYVQELEEV